MVEPYSPQMTIQYNTAHAHCILDTKSYRQTLRIRQSGLHENASVLFCAHIACLFSILCTEYVVG